MRANRAFVALIPLIFLLSACAPVAHVAGPHPTVAHHTPKASVTPLATPTPTVTAPPPAPAINPAQYLIEGTPNVPDANGEWYGEWAFYTDASKSVWCQFTIFSGDNPGAACSILPAARAQATYSLPPGRSVGCATSDWDGYTLAMGGSADDLQPNADAGWDQCFSQDSPTAADLAKSPVLPNGATLTEAPFTCTVQAGVATCAMTDAGNPSVTITLGLHTASFHSTS